MKINVNMHDTELGTLTICAENDYIIYLGFGTGEDTLIKYFSRFFNEIELINSPSPAILQLERELSEYFNKERTNFDIKYKLYGTEFRLRVWHELEKIPYGTIRSYGDIARAIGNPRASRAVGGANHNNPISIIVPCHRVIGSGGGLTGYGGGIHIKEHLLKLEGIR